jgi:hypothetical protein
VERPEKGQYDEPAPEGKEPPAMYFMDEHDRAAGCLLTHRLPVDENAVPKLQVKEPPKFARVVTTLGPMLRQ